MQNKVIKKIEVLKDDASLQFIEKTFKNVIAKSQAKNVDISNSKYLLKSILDILKPLYKNTSS